LKRRGRLHAFEVIDPKTTALVVIDLDEATVGNDDIGVDRILIAGTVTNICCESSARDAVELDYKVIMISDALSGQAHGLLEATLATVYRTFGDVRPSEDVIRLLR
jgi:nicotinamidase-related amidase